MLTIYPRLKQRLKQFPEFQKGLASVTIASALSIIASTGLKCLYDVRSSDYPNSRHALIWLILVPPQPNDNSLLSIEYAT